MEYYEQIYQIKEIKGYFFKIERTKPTKIFAVTNAFVKIMNPDARVDMDALEQVGDFITDTLLFSKTKEGEFKKVHEPGLDSYELDIIETNPMAINYFVKLYFDTLIKKNQKH